MKTPAYFTLALICALFLSSCTAPATEEPPSVESIPSPQPVSLTAPPELTVSTLYNADSVVASCGNYQWTCQLSDGTSSVSIACGADPLTAADESNLLYTAFPPGTLPPLEEGQMLGMIIPVYFLDFGETPPETVTVRRWPASYAQDSLYEDAEEVPTEPEDGGFTLYPMGDGEFVYEIFAEWGETDTAYYVFHTLPEVRGADCINRESGKPLP